MVVRNDGWECKKRNDNRLAEGGEVEEEKKKRVNERMDGWR